MNAVPLIAALVAAVGLLAALIRSRRTSQHLGRELDAQTALLTHVVDKVSDLVVVTDPSGRVVLRNHPAALERMRADAADHDCDVACAWLHSDDVPAVDSVTVEGRHLSVSLDSYGEKYGRVLVGRDMTSLRRLEDEAAASLTEVAGLADALRTFQSEGDARIAACRAAAGVADSSFVALLELDDRDCLTMTASHGQEVAPLVIDPLGFSRAHLCLHSGRFTMIADTDSHQVNDLEWLLPLRAELGPENVRAVVFLPLPNAVLVVTLRDPLTSGDARRLALLDIVARDASYALDRQRMVEQLRDLAMRDALTDLPNRRTWDTELQREIRRAKRLGQPLSVAMIDVDHFKAYNDTHGHGAGDDLLRELADVWSSMLRTTDVLARLGGEEFGVVLPGCDVDAATRVVGQLLRAAEEIAPCSAGLAPWTGDTAEAVLAQADKALYDAKDQGRNRLCVANPVIELSTLTQLDRRVSEGRRTF